MKNIDNYEIKTYFNLNFTFNNLNMKECLDFDRRC